MPTPFPAIARRGLSLFISLLLAVARAIVFILVFGSCACALVAPPLCFPTVACRFSLRSCLVASYDFRDRLSQYRRRRFGAIAGHTLFPVRVCLQHSAFSLALLFGMGLSSTVCLIRWPTRLAFASRSVTSPTPLESALSRLAFGLPPFQRARPSLLPLSACERCCRLYLAFRSARFCSVFVHLPTTSDRDRPRHTGRPPLPIGLLDSSSGSACCLVRRK